MHCMLVWLTQRCSGELSNKQQACNLRAHEVIDLLRDLLYQVTLKYKIFCTVNVTYPRANQQSMACEQNFAVMTVIIINWSNAV